MILTGRGWSPHTLRSGRDPPQLPERRLARRRASTYACFVVAVTVLLTPPSLMTAARSSAGRIKVFPCTFNCSSSVGHVPLHFCGHSREPPTSRRRTSRPFGAAFASHLTAAGSNFGLFSLA